jgi:hypothetical protein
MLVREARELAAAWVADHAHTLTGVQGAFMTGSAIWRPSDSELPPTSDVDVMVVLAGPKPPVKLGKVRHQGVLLDVTYLDAAEVQSPEAVLGSFYLASSFARPSILLDPTGHLAALTDAVSPEYARRHWVRKRCEHGWSNAARPFSALSGALPLHDQALIWLFGTAASTIVLLCAGVRNPTVRTRYIAARHLLDDFGLLHEYEPLLAVLGCARMSPEDVERHLAALEPVFDAAANVVKSPFFFASEISADGRPIAIDGSRDLIERGYHREATFYVVATFARCDKILYHDAPPMVRDEHLGSFLALLDDLGVGSTVDLLERARLVEERAPHLWELTDTIMTANPEIID